MSDAAAGTALIAADVLDFLSDRAHTSAGDSSLPVRGAAGLTPGHVGCLSFAKHVHDAGLHAIEFTESTVLLVPIEIVDRVSSDGRFVIAVEQPRREFARVVDHFFTTRPASSVHPSAVIDSHARIGDGTSVGAGAYIADDVIIGDDCIIGANAVILAGTRVGDNTSIGPSTTVGYTGFGYVREDDGQPLLIPHSGGVVIGSHVEIGANTCIDRGTLDDTVIDDHVKIDNLVHIAHNCHIGNGAFVIATAILCGGVRIGERAWIAPNVSIREQLTIGADAVVGLASTVVKNVPDGATVVGSPAREITR